MGQTSPPQPCNEKKLNRSRGFSAWPNLERVSLFLHPHPTLDNLMMTTRDSGIGKPDLHTELDMTGKPVASWHDLWNRPQMPSSTLGKVYLVLIRGLYILIPLLILLLVLCVALMSFGRYVDNECEAPVACPTMTFILTLSWLLYCVLVVFILGLVSPSAIRMALSDYLISLDRVNVWFASIFKKKLDQTSLLRICTFDVNQ